MIGQGWPCRVWCKYSTESNLVQDLNFKSKLKQFQPVCLFETDVKDSSWLHISIRNDLDGITVM